MKKPTLILMATLIMTCGCTSKNKESVTTNETAKQEGATVYLTREITPESLVKIYKALGVEATGRVAVKISTGEGSNPNYLKPELIKDLVYEVDGTIVECNTAYGNGPGDEKDERNNSAVHWEVIRRHGFTDYFPVDIMDEYDEMRIPVKDQRHIKYDIVGRPHGQLRLHDCAEPLQGSSHGWLRRRAEEPQYRLCQQQWQSLHPLVR